MSAEDVDGVRRIYRVFFDRGAAIRFSPNYAELMAATDAAGVYRSYLSSESNFTFVRDLEASNLVVPVVGDFAGPKAIRAMASYLKSHGATVTAFYLSNVEEYLYAGKWMTFCRNVATLPLDAASTFIRSSPNGFGFAAREPRSSLGPIAEEVRSCARPQ